MIQVAQSMLHNFLVVASQTGIALGEHLSPEVDLVKERLPDLEPLPPPPSPPMVPPALPPVFAVPSPAISPNVKGFEKRFKSRVLSPCKIEELNTAVISSS
jgi:hypothetical protein